MLGQILMSVAYQKVVCTGVKIPSSAEYVPKITDTGIKWTMASTGKHRRESWKIEICISITMQIIIYSIIYSVRVLEHNLHSTAVVFQQHYYFTNV